MSVERAKQRLERQPGEPTKGYLDPNDVQTSYDDLADGWRGEMAAMVARGVYPDSGWRRLPAFTATVTFNTAIRYNVVLLWRRQGQWLTTGTAITRLDEFVGDPGTTNKNFGVPRSLLDGYDWGEAAGAGNPTSISSVCSNTDDPETANVAYCYQLTFALIVGGAAAGKVMGSLTFRPHLAYHQPPVGVEVVAKGSFGLGWTTQPWPTVLPGTPL